MGFVPLTVKGVSSMNTPHPTPSHLSAHELRHQRVHAPAAADVLAVVAVRRDDGVLYGTRMGKDVQRGKAYGDVLSDIGSQVTTLQKAGAGVAQPARSGHGQSADSPTDLP